MSLEDLKLQIQRRKDMKDIKGKLGVLASVNKGVSKLIEEFQKLRESQSNEVVVKNLPDPVKEVSVSNFPKQKDSVKIDGEVSLKQPKWFSLKGIEKALKTVSDKIEKAVFKVDLDKYQKGNEAISVRLVDKDGKPYVAKGNGAYPSFGSVNLKDASGADIDPSTKAGQEAIVAAIESITIPAPEGGATEAKQDATIAAIENMEIPAPEGSSTEERQIDMTQALLEILSGVRSIASAKGILSDLRVTLIGGTTAVTGTLTGVTTVTTVSTVTNQAQMGGVPANALVPANQNLLATMANINNVG
jgi:hypothetical protein